jgi:hypothetical protein
MHISIVIRKFPTHILTKDKMQCMPVVVFVAYGYKFDIFNFRLEFD